MGRQNPKKKVPELDELYFLRLARPPSVARQDRAAQIREFLQAAEEPISCVAASRRVPEVVLDIRRCSLWSCMRRDRRDRRRNARCH
jgi:hypothetical protein